MSQEEIKQLLLSRNISPNKLLGQNFMVEPAFYPKLSSYAGLNSFDVVLDAGAGFGFLTRFLSDKCKGVVAVEKDPQLAAFLREQFRTLGNVSLVEGDFLKAELPSFNKVIAIPPYYLSSHFVMWVLESRVDCAVMIVQKEFAQRLVASVGSGEYGWLTVFVHQQAETELLDAVSKDMFYPEPEVDSVIVKLKPWRIKPFEVQNKAVFVRLIKWLFTQRNKKLAKAMVPFIKSNFKFSKQDAEKLAQRLPHCENRVRELSPRDFGAITNALPN
jgi:16S rRNA (adenine1518-N6/adenine1519-N6)-dimethyltransferase